MIKTGSIYYASDKALFDALRQQKMTKEAMRSLFLSRGILISPKTDKEELARHFSRLIHDYFDHQNIAERLASSQRIERNTSTRLDGEMDMEMLEKMAQNICDQQTEMGANARVITRTGGLDILIDYKTVDYKKSEFRQVEKKSATIVFDLRGRNLNIRSPINDYIEDVKEKCVDLIYEQFTDSEPPKISKISLEAHPKPETRTLFFTQLISSLAGHKLVEATDVWVFNPDDQDEDEEDSIGVHIKKAMLVGEQVSRSPELKKLIEDDFYISKVVWTAKTEAFDADMYTFEASFLDPAECSTFAYRIKGVNRYSEAHKMLLKDRTPVTNLDAIRLAKVIEDAARKTLEKIKGSENDSD